MTVAEYTRLVAQIAVLKEVAEEYPDNDHLEHHRPDGIEKK